MKVVSIYSFTISFLFIVSIQAQDESESLTAELQIADLELQDDCENLSESLKASLILRNFTEQITGLEHHRYLLENQRNILQSYEDIPFEVLRNWTVLMNAGDTMLLESEWSKLVTYSARNEEVIFASKEFNDYQHKLENVRNKTSLKFTWLNYTSMFLSKKNEYPSILKLVNNAALQNGQKNAKTYWEMLTDQENGYEKADSLWEEIKPLYIKLFNFTKTRIFKFYNISKNNPQIPVYLLGSSFGYDWNYVADVLLPHPQIHYEAKVKLNRMSIKDIYKLAENLTEQLSLGSFESKFWLNSLFNMTSCETTILSFCSKEYSELVTCNKTSWVVYMDAFEAAIDIVLRKNDYLTFPRSKLRYSPIEEAIISLGSTLAVNNMKFNGILDKEIFSSTKDDDSNKMTELLLTALRVLPKLSFYLAADKWRLNMLENTSTNFEETWWNFRKEFQGLEGIYNNESDYLGNYFMISNRPYLSQFFGLILQFQFLEYYKNNMVDRNDNVALKIGEDENFLAMILEKSSTKWENLLATYYGFDELSANSLLDYFKPLEKYLDSAPQEQEKIITTTIPKPTTEDTHLNKVNMKKQFSFKEEKVNASLLLNSNPNQKKHIHEIPQDGPNTKMGKITTIIGLILLGGICSIVLYVYVSKKVNRQNRRNNRRFIN